MKSSSISNINISDRGDYISTDDKNQYIESIKENYFQSNLASGESEYNQIYFSKSSSTFIIPSEITIEQNIDNNIIHSNIDMKCFTSTKENNNYHQFHQWFKENWISLTISTGIIMIFIIIIITTLIIY